MTWRPRRSAVEAWLVSRAAVLALMAFTGWLQAKHGYGLPHLRPGASGFYAWDGDWYRHIAAYGYDVPEALRFFPLAALPGRLLAPLGAFAAGLGVLAVVNVSALAYAEGVARVTERELGEERAARWVPWLVLVNPASYVLVIGYAEALAGLLAVGCFLALRRRAWWPAAGLAFLSGLCRPVGVLLALPALVEAWPRGPWPAPREVAARALPVAAAPLGLASYLLWCLLARGDALLPFRVQQAHELRSGVLTWPTGPLGKALHEGRVQERLHLLWVPLVVALLVLVWRRLPRSYGLWTAAMLVLALGTPRLASFERYSVAAFPLLVVAASSRPRSVRFVTSMVCGLGLAGYSVLAFAHRYVP